MKSYLSSTRTLRNIGYPARLPAALTAALALPLLLAPSASAQNNRWYNDRDGQQSDYETTPGYSSEMDHDAYYDGYFDGFYDDDFGMNTWDADSSARYAASYTSGYHDGYYDARQEFDFEPAYYILDHDDDDLDTDTADQRSKDKVRKQGDRADRDGQKAAGWMKDLERRRGTIKKMSAVETDTRPDDHTVLRLTMEDGKTLTADFGPELERDEIPFSEGDRVTLAGKEVTQDGTTYLVIEKITVGEVRIALRGDRQRPMAMGGPDRGREVRYNGWQRQWPAGRDRNRFVAENQDDRERGNWNRNGDGRNASSFDRSQRISLTGQLRDVERSREVMGQSVFLVELADGRTRMMAMNANEAERLRMREGDRVRITGRWTTLDGRDVIRVSRLRRERSED
jgi:translation initiation factor IF-1